MKRDLYIDCDGVIFDTMVIAFSDMELMGIDTTNQEAITNYFRSINWEDLIKRSGEINNSCMKILKLKASNVFNLVAIATHHCSYLEGKVKKDKFNKLLPNVQVFNIPRNIEKHHAVKAKDNILVDDSRKKIIGWINAGGYGVLFDKNTSNLEFPTNEKPYFITNDLNSLVFINNYINEYKKLKVKAKNI